MDIPLHWLQARTKAGRNEIERRSSNQREAVKEIRMVGDALGFLEEAHDLSLNQIKVTIAKQRVALEYIRKSLKENQIPSKDDFQVDSETESW